MLKRSVLLACGLACVVAAGVGVFVPLLPTTPVLLLAAACFARSSRRLHGWLLSHRVFGPVLAVGRAKSWRHALEWANDSEYGLTGAVYSRDRDHLEEARHEFHVGNLYLNRKCTGALVGVHPFGGFNMSGTDSKAGGRDYLLLFTQAKVISELL